MNRQRLVGVGDDLSWLGWWTAFSICWPRSGVRAATSTRTVRRFADGVRYCWSARMISMPSTSTAGPWRMRSSVSSTAGEAISARFSGRGWPLRPHAGGVASTPWCRCHFIGEGAAPADSTRRRSWQSRWRARSVHRRGSAGFDAFETRRRRSSSLMRSDSETSMAHLRRGGFEAQCGSC